MRRHSARAPLLLISLLLACDASPASTGATVAAIELSPTSLSLVAGDARGITAQARDASGNALRGARLVWSVRDPAIATVSSTGVVEALAPGTTQVSASAGGVSGVVDLSVARRPTSVVRVTPPASTILVGATVDLRAEALDNAGKAVAGRPTQWRSSNAAVAAVSASGEVTGVAAGSATVTATIDGVSDAAAITVQPVPVASVTVSPATASLRIGDRVQLVATTADAKGNTLRGRPVTWFTSDANVATVSSTGLVTGNGFGTATITASSEGKSGTARVSVSLLGAGAVVPRRSVPPWKLGRAAD